MIRYFVAYSSAQLWLCAGNVSHHIKTKRDHSGTATGANYQVVLFRYSAFATVGVWEIWLGMTQGLLWVADVFTAPGEWMDEVPVFPNTMRAIQHHITTRAPGLMPSQHTVTCYLANFDSIYWMVSHNHIKSKAVKWEDLAVPKYSKKSASVQSG